MKFEKNFALCKKKQDDNFCIEKNRTVIKIRTNVGQMFPPRTSPPKIKMVAPIPLSSIYFKLTCICINNGVLFNTIFIVTTDVIPIGCI